MKVVVFGATGMVGQGVVRECLLAPDVESVVSVGRSPSDVRDPKFQEVVTADLLDYSEIDLSGVDACFFCLGVSSTGVSEADYRRVTYDITMAAASAVVAANPAATFVYVSGVGADSTEKGRTMWARVRGATENALLATSLQAYVLRPGYIQPMHGATSRTRLYRVLYRFVRVLYPALRAVFPKHVSTTERIGRAMLGLARHGAEKRILYSADFNAITP
ncbi:NAD(P)H-binding protein [Actinophytocola sp.]|uniref:NAD(P)H-binding protein n=1 Tax=Actinophytocola sp. TaxID=1872138 RepID=UPI002D3686DD|nr:NAD(P)H-binding protein [Actinophytocola sp.]HYQ68244.1 NAD(P)H-binding protein [Actinophytocola sp.]